MGIHDKGCVIMSDYELKKITEDLAKSGQNLPCTIYNHDGKMLLNKNAQVKSEKQAALLNARGYIQVKPKRAFILNRSTQTITSNFENDSIFTTLHSWEAELALIFEVSQEQECIDFEDKVLGLAVHIQREYKRNGTTLLAALQIIEEDNYTVIHTLHCAIICEVIAKQEGITQIDRLAIVAGALTHDIGFIEVQSRLHLQPNKLSAKQKKHVHKHPSRGELLLKRQKIDNPVWLDIVRHHHERLDGSGYPDGLANEQISIPVRIMSIADTYSALCHTTFYRLSTSSNKAIMTLNRHKAQTLDENIVNRFILKTGVYPVGSLVRLENKEVGVVTSLNNSLKSPIITVLVNTDETFSSESVHRKTSELGLGVVNAEPVSKFPLLHEKLKRMWEELAHD